MVIEDMFALERAVYQWCIPVQLPLSQACRVQQAKVCSLPARPRCRRCSFASQFSFSFFISWTSSMCGLKGETTTFTRSTFPPLLPQSVFPSNRIPVGTATSVHSPLPAAIAGLLARRQPHNAPTLHSAWTSLQLPRQQPGSRSSKGAVLSWKNNNSNSRITRTVPLRHVFADGAHLIAEAYVRDIPSARIPGPVKLEPPLGSYPSPSGFVQNWLRHDRCVTVAHRSFYACVQLNIPPQSVHVVSPFTSEVCLAPSLHQKVLIRLHAHHPSQDTSHSESHKQMNMFK